MKKQKLEQLSKKLNLNVECLKDIIVCNHELKYLHSSKSLKEVELKLDLDTIKRLNKIAKALKVNISSIVCVAMRNSIKKINETNKA